MRAAVLPERYGISKYSIMLLRISGAFFIAAAAALCGFLKADQLRRNEAVCRSVRELLMKSGYLIRYRSLTVYELCAVLKECSFSDDLTFISNLPEEHIPGKDFSCLWLSALDTQKGIPPEERELLLRFGTELGNSDSEGQAEMINALSEETALLLVRRKEEYQKYGRLWRNVSILAGLMLFVLII